MTKAGLNGHHPSLALRLLPLGCQCNPSARLRIAERQDEHIAPLRWLLIHVHVAAKSGVFLSERYSTSWWLSDKSDGRSRPVLELPFERRVVVGCCFIVETYGSNGHAAVWRDSAGGRLPRERSLPCRSRDRRCAF